MKTAKKKRRRRKRFGGSVEADAKRLERVEQLIGRWETKLKLASTKLTKYRNEWRRISKRISDRQQQQRESLLRSIDAADLD